MSTGIPKTNFSFIEDEFSEIVEIRDGCSGLKNQPPGAVRKTIVFGDLSKLHCQEYIKEGFIEFYHYDYYDSRNNIIIKFHSEPHEEKAYQTATEPFHMHVLTDETDLKASKRLENKHFKELYLIIAFLINGTYLKPTYTRQHEHSIKKGK